MFWRFLPTDLLFGISSGHISATGHLIHFMFGSQGRRIELRYFRYDQIQDGDRPPSWKISKGHNSATGHPIHFMFISRMWFSGSAYRVGQCWNWPKRIGGGGSAAEMFEILPRDWSLWPIFTQKWASV